MTTKSVEKGNGKGSSGTKMEDLYRLREIYRRSSMWIRDVKLDGQDICPTRNRKYINKNGKCAAGGGEN
tara:strand:+ start:456 stop:662 length:207 start_codon:yes stop_codon:yes gene_type:complete